jgi:hypothetical protein
LQRRTKQKRLDRKICREEQNKKDLTGKFAEKNKTKKTFQRFNKIIFNFAKSSRKGMRKSPFSVTSSPVLR